MFLLNKMLVRAPLLSVMVLHLTGCPSNSHAPSEALVTTATNAEVSSANQSPSGGDSALYVEKSVTVSCRSVRYNLQRVRSADKKINEIRLVGSSDSVEYATPVPTQDEFNGFALNWLKRVSEGFQISVEFGSRIYHEMVFNFRCIETGFYLFRIEHSTFDKHAPEDADKYVKETILVSPNLPLEKFSLVDQMNRLLHEKNGRPESASSRIH